MWQILHARKYIWIRMNLCLEEAAAVTTEMWGLIDGQPTWVAFKFGKGTALQFFFLSGTKNSKDEFLVPAPQETTCVILPEPLTPLDLSLFISKMRIFPTSSYKWSYYKNQIRLYIYIYINIYVIYIIIYVIGNANTCKFKKHNVSNRLSRTGQGCQGKN